MKLRILSDLHTEFWKGESLEYKKRFFVQDWTNQQNDVLILAGDISVGPAKLKFTLEYFSEYSNHVIYIPGNHEYYGYNLESYKDLKLPSNVHFLNPGWIKLEDVTFIAATLWTDFHNDPIAAFDASRGITDFKRIKTKHEPFRFTPKDCQNLHVKERKFILDAYKSLPGRKVIITHFIPHETLITPYWQQHGGLLNKYFAPNMDLEYLQPEVWVFGHTHDCSDQVIGNTRFVANPFGYLGYENQEDFDPSKIIEL